MNQDEILNVIKAIFDAKPMLQGIDNDAVLFDLGVSSLTIVDLQFQVEDSLGIKVSTEMLMENPTIEGWAEAYADFGA